MPTGDLPRFNPATDLDLLALYQDKKRQADSMTTFCNPYGSENPGGHAVNNLAAFEPVPAVVKQQWNCDRRDTHRFRWVCEHGHKGGQVVDLCPKHWAELNGERTYPDTGQPVPIGVRRDVGFCPRCNTESDHRCTVRLEHVS